MYSCIYYRCCVVNPNGIKTLLANGLIKFFINGNPVFTNGPRRLTRNPLNCIILDNWAFYKLTSVGELFAKVLRRFTTCLLVNNISYLIIRITNHIWWYS